MPAPTHVIVISPIAKLADVLSVLGVTPTTSLYTAADAPVRTETHRVRSGPVSSAQMAIVDAHIASPHPDLAGVTCVKWTLSDPSPYNATLASLGLTTLDGSI